MKTIFIITIFHLLSSCADNAKNIYTPIHFNSIPPTAFWAGSSSGGNWFVIKDIHDHKNSALIDVYSDKDGSLILSKQFSLECHLEKPSFDEAQYFRILDSLPAQILSFDGNRIILKTVFNNKNCVLQ
jgi:hypothetical protein